MRRGSVSHLCVVLLQVGQLVLQAFDLQLEVGLRQGGLVQEAAEVADVSLNGLAHHQLVLEPDQVQSATVRKQPAVKRLQLHEEPALLGFEVIRSQFGVIDLQQDVGVFNGGAIDLKRRETVVLSVTACLQLHEVNRSISPNIYCFSAA